MVARNLIRASVLDPISRATYIFDCITIYFKKILGIQNFRSLVCLFVSVLGWCPLMRRVRATYLLGGQMGIMVLFQTCISCKRETLSPLQGKKNMDVGHSRTSQTSLLKMPLNWPQAFTCF